MEAFGTTALARELTTQRWFRNRVETIVQVVALDWHQLPDDETGALGLFEVRFEGGGTDIYLTPFEVVGQEARILGEPNRLASVGRAMAHGTTAGSGGPGLFHYGGAGLDPLDPPGAGSARVMGAEQTNTSIVLDDSVILKLFRRLESGLNPDLEMTRMLTSAGFEHVPAQVGEINYSGVLRDQEVSFDLGVAQRFLGDATPGWDDAIAGARAWVDNDQTAGSTIAAPEGGAPVSLVDLGDVTASMHVLLTLEELAPAFTPEPLEHSDLKLLAESIRAAADAIEADGVADLTHMRASIESRLSALEAIEDAGLKIRVHGDLHLGQTLRTPKGWMLIDFEGEPSRSIADRRMKQSPLKDVAGMLRSFDYAAAVAAWDRDQTQDLGTSDWAMAARDDFLLGYLRTAHGGTFLPAERADLMVLLDVFEIDKALYEISYEAHHRPDWLEIPLRGLAAVLDSADRA